ncbi:transcription termination/antitermination protein NusA [Candidatus Falkowbacteria bacterium]|nr:transcription termination/antitermination protein NusA [Candidatus Falkowbacteria bacterium]
MSDISNAMKQICEEKGLSYEAVLETVESALAAAYRKDFGEKNQNIKVEFDPETGKSKVYDVKMVVEDLPEEMLEQLENGEEGIVSDAASEEEGEEGKKFNPKTEIQIKDAKLIKKTVKIDDELRIKLEPPVAYGRMAAQTAKQVIIQRLREAERDMVFSEFKDKENEVVTGVIQRREGGVVFVDMGKAVGILLPDEQIHGERYNIGERVKVYVKEVRLSSKGPEIILSRTSDEILKKVFYLEIPEISNGLIEIKSVAREAGHRSKVAVFTSSDKVDPIGSCVGQRGARIQTIIQELGGEKVDIISYDDDASRYIANALAPAKISSVELKEEDRRAVVKVAEDQLSLAIGKGGQNARLAAHLTGWKIDIITSGQATQEPIATVIEEEAAEEGFGEDINEGE